MKPPTAIALIAAAAAASVAAVWSLNAGRATPHSGAASSTERVFLPTLSERINDAASISIHHQSGTYVVSRDASGIWRLEDKGGYPVKPEAVRQVLVGLADLREWETKTSQPDKYTSLGVEDPVPSAANSADPGATPSQAIGVAVKDSAGATLADLIVGNRKWGQSQSQHGVYVRRAGEAESWLARGQLEVPRETIAWLDTQFVNVARSRVQSVTVERSGAAPIVVSRATDTNAFTLENIPAGRELKDTGTPESIGSSFSLGTFQDVAKADVADFSGAEGAPPLTTITLRTFDGLIVTAKSANANGRLWWLLSASAAEPAPAASEPTDSAASGPDAEKVRKEAAELNARWSGFAFSPTDYKVRNLTQTLDDLLKDVTPAAGAPPTQPDAGQPAAPDVAPPAEPQAPTP